MFWKDDILKIQVIKQWINCLILNTPVFYLIFVIITLIPICFSKLSSNLTMEPFKQSIILKIQLFHWRLRSRTYIKRQLPYPVIHIFYLFFFHFDFKNAIKYTVILSKFLFFLWKPFFPRSDTRPTQVGDMDPWTVTWPNLSDLIGWGQKMSSISW